MVCASCIWTTHFALRSSSGGLLGQFATWKTRADVSFDSPLLLNGRTLTTTLMFPPPVGAMLCSNPYAFVNPLQETKFLGLFFVVGRFRLPHPQARTFSVVFEEFFEAIDSRVKVVQHKTKSARSRSLVWLSESESRAVPSSEGRPWEFSGLRNLRHRKQTAEAPAPTRIIHLSEQTITYGHYDHFRLYALARSYSAVATELCIGLHL